MEIQTNFEKIQEDLAASLSSEILFKIVSKIQALARKYIARIKYNKLLYDKLLKEENQRINNDQLESERIKQQNQLQQMQQQSQQQKILSTDFNSSQQYNYGLQQQSKEDQELSFQQFNEDALKIEELILDDGKNTSNQQLQVQLQSLQNENKSSSRERNKKNQIYQYSTEKQVDQNDNNSQQIINKSKQVLNDINSIISMQSAQNTPSIISSSKQSNFSSIKMGDAGIYNFKDFFDPSKQKQNEKKSQFQQEYLNNKNNNNTTNNSDFQNQKQDQQQIIDQKKQYLEFSPSKLEYIDGDTRTIIDIKSNKNVQNPSTPVQNNENSGEIRTKIVIKNNSLEKIKQMRKDKQWKEITNSNLNKNKSKNNLIKKEDYTQNLQNINKDSSQFNIFQKNFDNKNNFSQNRLNHHFLQSPQQNNLQNIINTNNQLLFPNTQKNSTQPRSTRSNLSQESLKFFQENLNTQQYCKTEFSPETNNNNMNISNNDQIKQKWIKFREVNQINKNIQRRTISSPLKNDVVQQENSGKSEKTENSGQKLENNGKQQEITQFQNQQQQQMQQKQKEFQQQQQKQDDENTKIMQVFNNCAAKIQRVYQKYIQKKKEKIQNEYKMEFAYLTEKKVNLIESLNQINQEEQKLQDKYKNNIQDTIKYEQIFHSKNIRNLLGLYLKKYDIVHQNIAEIGTQCDESQFEIETARFKQNLQNNNQQQIQQQQQNLINSFQNSTSNNNNDSNKNNFKLNNNNLNNMSFSDRQNFNFGSSKNSLVLSDYLLSQSQQTQNQQNNNNSQSQSQQQQQKNQQCCEFKDKIIVQLGEKIQELLYENDENFMSFQKQNQKIRNKYNDIKNRFLTFNQEINQRLYNFEYQILNQSTQEQQQQKNNNNNLNSSLEHMYKILEMLKPIQQFVKDNQHNFNKNNNLMSQRIMSSQKYNNHSNNRIIIQQSQQQYQQDLQQGQNSKRFIRANTQINNNQNIGSSSKQRSISKQQLLNFQSPSGSSQQKQQIIIQQQKQQQLQMQIQQQQSQQNLNKQILSQRQQKPKQIQQQQTPQNINLNFYNNNSNSKQQQQ